MNQPNYTFETKVENFQNQMLYISCRIQYAWVHVFDFTLIEKTASPQAIKQAKLDLINEVVEQIRVLVDEAELELGPEILNGE